MVHDCGRKRERIGGRPGPDRQDGEVVIVPAPAHDQVEARAGVAAKSSEDELAVSIGMIDRM